MLKSLNLGIINSIFNPQIAVMTCFGFPSLYLCRRLLKWFILLYNGPITGLFKTDGFINPYELYVNAKVCRMEMWDI